MEQDKSSFLGTEDVKSLLWRLSLPAFIGMGSNALYNLVDTIFVGRGMGATGIAALSIAFPMQMLIGAFSLTFGVGGASLMSIRLGQGNEKAAKQIAGNSFVFGEIIAVLLLLCTYLFMDPILRILGASQQIAPYTQSYLSIIMIGGIPLTFSMITNNQLRAQGDAKDAMSTMLLGTFINIALDPIFIFGLKMGIRGAALATIISQFSSAALAVYFLVSAKKSLKLDKTSFIVKWENLTQTVSLGMATFIRQIGMSLVALVVNLSLARYGGDMSIAAYGMINRLTAFFTMPLMGIAQGLQPLAGYNFGAGKYDRMKKGVQYSIVATGTLALITMFLCIPFPTLMLRLFTNNSQLLALGGSASRIIFAAYLFVALQTIGSTYFQAIGKGGKAMLLSMSRQILTFIPLILLLPRFLQLEGIWLSFPLSDFLSGLLSIILMSVDMKKLGKQRNIPPSGIVGKVMEKE
ncbi:MAG: MATE family efflux transporter [Spirochaetia bacterium]|jgi:putative MATE family efflux protein|nr:MATE family efflux transporter [Spirochaetia bacterium]